MTAPSPNPVLVKNGMHQYSLVIRPGAPVREIIREERKFFTDENLKATMCEPEIPVASFEANELMEETFIRWIERICYGCKSFPLTLNNFSGSPGGMVYLRIMNDTHLVQLVRQLQVVNNYISSGSLSGRKFETWPGLSVAGDIPDEVYRKVLTHYAGRDLNISFDVNELLLIRHDNTGGAKTVNIFRLPSPVQE
jgi:hypothetical protein